MMEITSQHSNFYLSHLYYHHHHHQSPHLHFQSFFFIFLLFFQFFAKHMSPKNKSCHVKIQAHTLLINLC